ncbi:MAG: hypothetical protein CL878_08870 [Dehalococcoidia bacterium]|nr:hypothetical protein [Dehalococcoidia bacterium]
MPDGMLGGQSIYQFVSLPVIGAVGGIIAGMVGSGGGVLVVPLLVYLSGVGWESATGISAAQYFFGAISGVVPHWRRRNVHLRVGTAMMVAGVVSAQLGALLSAAMPEWTLSLLYLLLAVVAATSLLFPTREERAGAVAVEMPDANWLFVGSMGTLVGLVDGILGVGGGFMLVPLMVYVLQMATRQAIGTSLFVIAGTMASAVTGKLMQGQVPLLSSALVTLGAVAGAQLGARLSGRLRPSVLRRMLSVMIYMVCLRILLDVLT